MSKHVSRLFLRFILTQLLTCLRGQKIAPITLTAIAPLTQTIIFVGVLQNSYLLTYKYQVIYGLLTNTLMIIGKVILFIFMKDI